MDLPTALAILGSADAGPAELESALGPTDERLGHELERLGRTQLDHLADLLRRARRKSPGDPEGKVPFAVVKKILDDATSVEDELAKEYFAGVLASSKSPNGRDNRGIALSALLSTLSSYSLRTHYILYAVARHLLKGMQAQQVPLNFADDAKRRVRIYTPFSVYRGAMCFEADEDGEAATNHALFALQRELLVHDNCSWGTLEHTRHIVSDVTEGGIVFTPSLPGLELFMWAHGLARQPWTTFLEETQRFAIERDFGVRPGSRLLPPDKK
jgi:hypothetical protein